MHLNTLKTVSGFCRAFIERRTPFGRKQETLDSIYNYLPISGLFPTSGQPSEAQFRLIQQAGYNAVINLAPNSILENSVVNEREILTQLGMEYIHIPVDFKKPTDDKFAEFVSHVEKHNDGKLWVHCAANMRVSAFTYRYRHSVLGHSKTTADADLRRIWNPIGVWKGFIKR